MGIAVDKPLLALTSGTGTTVQAALSGTADTLVSNVNGTIHAGDLITASPIAGIGMKAVRPTVVVGTAQADLDSSSTVTKSVEGLNGKPVTVKIGLIPVAISVAYYSGGSASGLVSAYVPPILQSFADAITGKEVSPLRVLMGTLALLLGFGIVAIMLSTSIRNELISLGRNPLARTTLLRALVDIILAAIAVALITLVAVYAILIA